MRNLVKFFLTVLILTYPVATMALEQTEGPAPAVVDAVSPNPSPDATIVVVVGDAVVTPVTATTEVASAVAEGTVTQDVIQPVDVIQATDVVPATDLIPDSTAVVTKDGPGNLWTWLGAFLLVVLATAGIWLKTRKSEADKPQS